MEQMLLESPLASPFRITGSFADPSGLWGSCSLEDKNARHSCKLLDRSCCLFNILFKAIDKNACAQACYQFYCACCALLCVPNLLSFY